MNLLPTLSCVIPLRSPGRERWNTLLISEEISRINSSLHAYQLVKVVLEILPTPNACLFITCVACQVIHSNVKIPVIDICFSRIFRNVRSHVAVKPSNPVNVPFRCLLAFFTPRHLMLNLVYISSSMWKWRARLRNLVHLSSIRN
ncbi:hypothetical protein NC653_028323 [Populus alba x Populus x berolinensis]|uniref:Uncharacterized protein n=1 Tax=Populus alba x Populus x berolinensis TaxID=444605 RepID=A0AAD6M7S8_9ROSI|nr:hypothetical protein NC653_028323 [Populus alba x Populus x berolinensis]